MFGRLGIPSTVPRVLSIVLALLPACDGRRMDPLLGEALTEY
jgi:hypothetical protein